MASSSSCNNAAARASSSPSRRCSCHDGDASMSAREMPGSSPVDVRTTTASSSSSSPAAAASSDPKLRGCFLFVVFAVVVVVVALVVGGGAAAARRLGGFEGLNSLLRGCVENPPRTLFAADAYPPTPTPPPYCDRCRASASSAFRSRRSSVIVASRAFGSFHTSERRGGVERRQLKLKGAEGGD
ncbi:uncharacterized protein MICPUCDRAFT_53787 [Micromonas pusilla CCMP1545]|uniref:Predicted protein n=1 Tax=Micromonas pusilla (strain CCMP1545) TaxID=564608 RepID=C1N7Q2_MICPC|nr:uncharacterized protein MICPUCDRAFT_53787 [Micromonas pusilla CCMP1545]EEH51754.1 predicted protein [Micromonas pusilla CCMP1545]|eukprot:XP_003064132.1 predicted protein [Micromonas pusilla CCMP1545]